MTIMTPKPAAPSHWNLDQVVAGLREQRGRWREARQRSLSEGAREFPARDAMQTIMDQLCGALFPMRLGPAELRAESEDYYVGHTLDTALNALHGQVQLELSYTARQQGLDLAEVAQRSRAIVDAFAAYLPTARGLLDTDVEAAYEGDPAARSVDEVLLCYPGVMAMIYHRLAHQLYQLDAPLGGDQLAIGGVLDVRLAGPRGRPGARQGAAVRGAQPDCAAERTLPAGQAGAARRAA